MTQLSGRQIGEIQEALLDAFPARDDLRMLVRIELDEKLEAIADGSNQRVVIFNLVSWAERTGRIDDLVQGAFRQNQGNPALQKLMASWRPAAASAADRAASPAAAPAMSGPVSIDLFLSYSRKNLPAMRTAKESLRGAGLAVWTDEGLEPGTESWTAAIQEAVAQAPVLVVLLSPEAKASAWVEREVTYAQTLGKRVFPVLISGDDRTAVPFRLITAQWVDGRQDLRQALRQDLQPALLRYLGRAQAAPAAEPEPVPATPPTPSPQRSSEQWFMPGAQAEQPMGSRTAALKRQALEEQLAVLGEQYAAANRQLNSALSDADAVKLRLQIADLERKMAAVEQQLDQIKGS